MDLVRIKETILKILQVFYSAFHWTANVILIILLGHIARITSFLIKNKKVAAWLWVSRVWAKALLALAIIRLKVVGKEYVPREGNCLLASNHESTLDIYILAAVIPIRFLFVMRKELFKVPLLGNVCKNRGDLPLDQKHPAQTFLDMKKIMKLLEEGESILFFPEGQRHQGLHSFKSGIARIAVESQKPVIPVAISGSGRLMPPKSFLLRPGRINVTFGKPLRFHENEEYQEVSQKIMDAIADMQKRGIA